MTYVISDIHGCYVKYMEMLREINFGPEDMLYVLGDVLDRGPDGFKILLDMASRPNVVALRGNHEDMAIRALPGILRCIVEGDMDAMTDEEAESMDLWFHNGGELSLADFLCLDNEQMQSAWEYMCAMPLYREVEVYNQKFVLLHGGLENFSPNRALEDYAPDEILWCRPKPDTVYYADKCVVVGHTPVQLLAGTKKPAKIYRKGNLIDIDCGCVYRGGQLGCLCLDTLEEFYVTDRKNYSSPYQSYAV